MVAFLFTAFLAWQAFDAAAIRYAREFPLAHVERNTLYQLGPAIADTAQTGLVIATVTVLLTVTALIIPATRSRAWLVPLVGAATWIVAASIGATMFQPPPPAGG